MLTNVLSSNGEHHVVDSAFCRDKCPQKVFFHVNLNSLDRPNTFAIVDSIL